MKPEDLAAIAARNDAAVQRAREAAEKGKPTALDGAADSSSLLLDAADGALTLATTFGGAIWDATAAVGKGIGAACSAAAKILPD